MHETFFKNNKIEMFTQLDHYKENKFWEFIFIVIVCQMSSENLNENLLCDGDMFDEFI